MLWVLLCAAVCAGAFLWLRWLRVRRHWAERGVPHRPPHPLLGSLTFLQKKNVGEWMRELYSELRAPYVGIWLFWRPALVINCPELARRVLVKDSDNFRNRLLSSGKNDPIGALNIFTANDPLWSSVRRRLSPTFTSAKLKNLTNLHIIKSKQLVQRIRMESDKKQKFDIKDILTDYTTDLIGVSALGVESDATLTGHSALRVITRDFQTYSTYRGIAWTSIFFFPELVNIFGFSFFPKASTDYFKKVFRRVVAQRGGYEQNIQESRDLVDALIKMKQDAVKDNEDMDEILLISQAAVLVQGGFETTATALTFCFYELAHEPEIQERLHQEVKEAKDKIGDADFNMETLARLPYTNAVWKETMRLYPPMGWLDRVCAQEYRIDEGLTVPAGTPLYVNAIGMQVDPEYFPDPYRFDPERFLPENEKNIKPFTYIPFGDGPRFCIGQRFAHHTLRYALTAVILSYELRPLPGTPRPRDCQIEKKGMFLLPGESYYIDFVPRT